MQTAPLFNQMPPTFLQLQAVKHESTDVRNFVIETQTCLDIFQGRVTAPRSHAVISIDLLRASNLISSYLLCYSQLKWFRHSTFFLSTKEETWELLCVLHLSSWILQKEHTQRTWFCAFQCRETVKDAKMATKKKNILHNILQCRTAFTPKHFVIKQK